MLPTEICISSLSLTETNSTFPKLFQTGSSGKKEIDRDKKNLDPVSQKKKKIHQKGEKQPLEMNSTNGEDN